jgi:hypothetical protein
MQRHTLPIASMFRRPRDGETISPRRKAKRLPITSLWDEMASAAPMEVQLPAPKDWAAEDRDAWRARPERGWDGRPFVDDDETEFFVPELVIRRVSGVTVAAAAAAYSESQTAAEWHDDEVDAEVVASSPRLGPAVVEVLRSSDWPAMEPRPLARPWTRLHAALLCVGLLGMVAAWRILQSGDPVAHAAATAPVERTPVLAPALTPAPTPEPQPVEPVAPALAAAAAADPIEAEPAVTPPIADVTDDAAPTGAAAPDPNFDYRSARHYLDEQTRYLRQTCMHKGKGPIDRLRVHFKVKPNGRAVVAVPGVGPEVADCVRKTLTFPFDRSPNGGAFLYSLSQKTSRLEPRPL